MSCVIAINVPVFKVPSFPSLWPFNQTKSPDQLIVSLMTTCIFSIHILMTSKNKEFVKKFHKLTGRYPSYAAEGAYAGIYAVAYAVKKVGNPDDAGKLIKALEGLKIKLPEDPEGFTSYISHLAMNEVMDQNKVNPNIGAYNKIHVILMVYYNSFHLFYNVIL